MFRITLILGLATVLIADTPVKMKDLPAAVQKTVLEQTKGVELRGLAKEVENGQTFYEAETRVNGHSKDILIDTSGAVVEVEEQVTLSALPEAVRAGLRTGAGSGKITKVESITKRGQLVAYEAQVTTHGKRSEIQVGPDGKPLAHEQ